MLGRFLSFLEYIEVERRNMLGRTNLTRPEIKRLGDIVELRD